MPNIIEIRDFDDPRLDVYARMTEAQLLNRADPERGMFIAESPRVIRRALDAGCEPMSCLVEKKQIEKQAREILLRCGEVPIFTAGSEVLSQLTGYKLLRGMLCVMRRPALPDPEDLCRVSRRVAVLENVMNPTNVGAIFRSAAAMHMDAVLLTPACSDPLYRRAVRVSMGTVFQIPWTFLKDSMDWPQPGLTFLREQGFRTAAMALSEQSVPVDDPCLSGIDRLAVVLGTEGDGLAPETIAGCDYTVRIPMSHGVDSLNVAAASAVAFWELRRR